jgi:hypothetical protein
MKRLLLLMLLLVGYSRPVWAQVAVTGFAGSTLDPSPTVAGYIDVGSRVTYEGWVGRTNGATSGGGDVIIVPKHLGVVVGGDNGGFHVGGAVNLFGVQVRIMRQPATDAWQSVINYTWSLGARTYVQAWAQPATNGSAYYMGVGYTLKK